MAEENVNNIKSNLNYSQIIIIGGGIAGISAACYLSKHELTDFKILEAKPILGGRIFTKVIGEHQVDLGSKWVHGVLGNPIYELAASNGLINVTDQEPQTHSVVALTEQGKKVPISLLEEVHDAYFWFTKRCEEYFLQHLPPPAEVNNSVGKHIRLDIERYLENYEGEEKRLRSLVFQHLLKKETCITGCNSMEEVSLSDFGSYEELPGGNITLPNGYISVLNHLVSSLPKDCIFTSHEVSKVDWTKENDLIKVHCENGRTFLTSHVIITVSLGFLQYSAKHFFVPPLPEYKLEAINNLGFGTVDKIYLHYERPFLNPDIQEVILLWSPVSPGEDTWYRKIYSFIKEKETLLVAWLSGREAELMESLSEEEIAECCTRILQKFLCDPYIPKPVKIVRSQWRQDAFSRGSYTFVPSHGSHDDIELLASPIYKNPYQNKPSLLFAGEATHPTFYSTTHGAYLSGQKAAQLLLLSDTAETT